MNDKTPISMLPSELLMVIFDLFCMSDPATLEMRRYDWDNLEEKFASLLKLTHVCHEWRAITTVSMPSLWSVIAVRWTYRSGKILFFTRLSLERSAACPLHILILPCVLHGKFPPRIEEFLSLLIPHHARWKSLNFLSAFSVLMDPHLFRSVNNFSNLEAAFVDLTSADETSELHRAIHASPRLSRYLWAPGHPESPVTFSTSVLSLWYSPGYEVPVTRVIQNLSHFQFLVDLWLNFVPTSSPEAARLLDSTVVLPCLRNFKLEINGGGPEIELLCDMLVLPSLRKLHLRYALDSSRIYRNTIRLLERSKCQLECLTIFDLQPERDAEQLQDFLHSRSLQFLRHLRIDGILDRLAIQSSILPHLHRFDAKHRISSSDEQRLLWRCVAEHVLSGIRPGNDDEQTARELVTSETISARLESHGVKLYHKEEKSTLLFSEDIFVLTVLFPAFSSNAACCDAISAE